MKKIIGIGEMYKHQLEWVYDVLSTEELNIPFIVMGDQPDGTFAHVKIYNR